MSEGRGAPGWIAWTGVGLLLVLLVPSLARSNELLWNRPPEQLPQHLTMGLAFLLFTLVLRAIEDRRSRVSLTTGAVAAAIVFGLGYAVLALQPDVPHSRVLMGMSAVIGTAAGLLPYLGTSLRAAAILGSAAVVAAAAVAVPQYQPPAPEPTVTSIETALQRLTLTRHPGLVEITSDGGALASHGDGMLLVTGSGRLHRVELQGDSLTVEPLSLEVPQNREAFVAAHESQGKTPRLRALGLVVDTAAQPVRVIVAHQYWHAEQGCFTMRVSAAPLDADGGSGTWTTLFESQPCVPDERPYSEWETGGRLAWERDGDLLLTLGDHGYEVSADNAFAQRDDVDYGKLLRLDPRTGEHEVISKGFRNPQGVTMARDGRIWLTDHGPQGGDEINLIQSGANYGWPLVTYGTAYGEFSWPLAEGTRDHGTFREPAYALVPSRGISAIVQLRGDDFAGWEGDLLAGTLGGRRLLRVRLRDDRVIYVESVPVGLRVRDLQQASNGRVVLWDDAGDLYVLAPAPALPRGEAAFQICAQCHGAADERDAPSLRGIVGADIARSETFPYSEALRSQAGDWTPERLDAFLADPQAFAPGTRMWYSVADAAVRSALIEYLTDYR